jgi:predicted glycosyltransferase
MAMGVLRETLGDAKLKEALQSNVVAQSVAQTEGQPGEVQHPEEESVSVLEAMGNKGDQSERLKELPPSLRAREAAANGFATGTRGDRKLADRYFDLVLVHADPRVARLDESFRPSSPLRVPVRHTGFVAPPRRAAMRFAPSREPRIVVSAGGGRVGGRLLRAALQAHRILRCGRPVHMTLIAGPFLPEHELAPLERSARDIEAVDVRRVVPNLSAELAGAVASVSQGGYNTILEILQAGVAAVVVPYTVPGEDEQMRRARRLEALGALRVLDPAELDGSRLADELVQTLAWRPRPLNVALDGAARSAELLHELVRPTLREAA